jgi:hypothetical protein
MEPLDYKVWPYAPVGESVSFGIEHWFIIFEIESKIK